MALAKISLRPRRSMPSPSESAGWVMSSFWSYSTRQYGFDNAGGLTSVRLRASMICRKRWPTGDLGSADLVTFEAETRLLAAVSVVAATLVVGFLIR